MKNDYKIGEEIIPKISKLNFWNQNAYILDTLEGTKCGENAVCFDVFNFYLFISKYQIIIL